MDLAEEKTFLIAFQTGKISREELIKQYQNLIRFYVARSVCQEDQEDCIQECLIDLFNIVPLYNFQNVKFSTFLLSKLRRITTNFRRTKRKELQRFRSLDRMMEEIRFDVAEEVKINDFEESFKIAIDSLTELEKNIIILHFFKEMQLKEVASILGIPYGSITKFEKRALNKIRIILGNLL